MAPLRPSTTSVGLHRSSACSVSKNRQRSSPSALTDSPPLTLKLYSACPSTHQRARLHRHTHPQARTPGLPDTQAHTYAHAHAGMQAHIHRHTCACRRAGTHVQADMPSQTCPHRHALACRHACACLQAHERSQPPSHACARRRAGRLVVADTQACLVLAGMLAQTSTV